MEEKVLDQILINALKEDIGEGDHSALAVIPEEARGKTVLLCKEDGILAGMRVIRRLFEIADPELLYEEQIHDGTPIKKGDQLLYLSGLSRSLLKVERLALNIIQRMSGIATLTQAYVLQTAGTRTKILDTRKTTPNLRLLEKEAVRLGGGFNHRMGLYDMIMLKDNHIDFAGGIRQAIERVNHYLKEEELSIAVEIEVRNFEELRQVIDTGGVNRIMFDNFTPEETKKAVEQVAGAFETEASGGIVLENVREYALTGVDFISIGALTHQIHSLDLSLKAIN